MSQTTSRVKRRSGRLSSANDPESLLGLVDAAVLLGDGAGPSGQPASGTSGESRGTCLAKVGLNGAVCGTPQHLCSVLSHRRKPKEPLPKGAILSVSGKANGEQRGLHRHSKEAMTTTESGRAAVEALLKERPAKQAAYEDESDEDSSSSESDNEYDSAGNWRGQYQNRGEEHRSFGLGDDLEDVNAGDDGADEGDDDDEGADGGDYGEDDGDDDDDDGGNGGGDGGNDDDVEADRLRLIEARLDDLESAVGPPELMAGPSIAETVFELDDAGAEAQRRLARLEEQIELLKGQLREAK
ncbi:hypothetical protein THAOC_34254, partial [Thalassiosira oceanica]